MAASLFAAMAAPVDAQLPSELTMTGNNPADFSPGTFFAEGTAVDNGIMCASGSTEYQLFELSGPVKNPNRINFKIRKEFTCDHESGIVGSFILKAQGRNVFGEGITFSWVILSGTGALEDLHGTGSGTAIDLDELGVDDAFVGGLHLN